MEIKFRVWDKENKSMSEGLSLTWFITGEHADIEFPKKDESLPLSDFRQYLNDFEFMQYTGLSDKKGNEVYHHDKLKSGKKIFLVHWQDEEARFILMPDVDNPDSWKFMDECNHMEVIGNIYENESQ